MSDFAADNPVFDVTAEQIARTYAEAFLGAVAQNATAVADLEAIDREVLAVHPQFLHAISSAFVDKAERLAMIDRVFGGRVTPSVVNLMKTLTAHDRLPIVRLVVRQVRLLFDEASGRKAVRIRVASPINDALVTEIASAIRAKLSFEPVISVEVVPELVGGLEIRVDDTVFDGTVQTAFAKAHRAIVAQTVEAIETQPLRFTTAG
ncbi:ATP synthase F1 subunit delta [Botrimarina hoheduenensis]|uniref:ATP synthase subunit delta n=1 Tax=Botrimarina hoheduenensis TaxID=2528000 RepID=A0A5C5WDS7_9BACT|nr:ATP synthase F1 subunit delta [Botrimarina hoheduenensis]TWT48854.1 ATP synthase subunit delta, sodium ion specific [Botrimarina hoheduenensis]